MDSERFNFPPPEGVFITEVKDDWMESKRKQLKISANSFVDDIFRKRVSNLAPKLHSPRAGSSMETIME